MQFYRFVLTTGTLRVFVLYPPAWRRINTEFRPGCLGLCPLWSWELSKDRDSAPSLGSLIELILLIQCLIVLLGRLVSSFIQLESMSSLLSQARLLMHLLICQSVGTDYFCIWRRLSLKTANFLALFCPSELPPYRIPELDEVALLKFKVCTLLLAFLTSVETLNSTTSWSLQSPTISSLSLSICRKARLSLWTSVLRGCPHTLQKPPGFLPSFHIVLLADDGRPKVSHTN